MRYACSTIVLGLAFIGTLTRCGGSEFHAGGAGGAGAGGNGAVPSGGTGVDSATGGQASDTGGATSDSTTIGPASCDIPSPDATDIYVDKRYSGTMPNGSPGCPFTTILDGINAPMTAGLKRTIHVAGDSPALLYQESTRILVGAGITLLGDGSAKVAVSASGACASKTCAVHVQAGGILDGFQVTCPQGNGIVTGTLQAASQPATVRNVIASNSALNGIVALGDVELGPGIVANSNGLPSSNGHGVSAEGAGLVHINASQDSANQFSNNAWHGINVAVNSLLKFDGGEAVKNGNNGIRLAQQCAPPPAVHLIQGLKALGNSNNGVAVYGGSLKLRSSILLASGHNGLNFNYTAGTLLDVGTIQEPGGNVFGGQTTSNNNTNAGIYLCNSAATATAQPYYGNQWSSCPPSQVSVATCGTIPATYADLVSASANAVTLTIPACAVGP